MKQTVVFFLASLLAFAGEITIPTAFSAQFTQKITSPDKKVLKYSGTLRFNRSGELQWRYQKPTKKEVCSNGRQVTVVDHDLEQVSFYKLNDQLDLTAILSHAKHHKKNLYVATYQGVYYTFSLDSRGRIDQIAYKDSLENVVNIHFYKVHYRPKAYSAQQMQCGYPASYDIIRG